MLTNIINALNPMRYVRRRQANAYISKVLERARFEHQCAIVRGA